MFQDIHCHWHNSSMQQMHSQHMLFTQELQPTITFIECCDHYHLKFIQPSSSTLCCYITYLTGHFQSSKSVYNISGVRVLLRQLELTAEVIDSFPIISLLHAADITMQTPPLGCLPILPHLPHQLCLIFSSLDNWGCPCECV